MSADLLSSSTPSRLTCRRGRWALELTRLVPVDNHVFQPRRQRLEGSEAILMHLKRQSEGTNLAHAAAQLMRSTRGEDERSFDAIEGEWVPSGHARTDESPRDSSLPPRQNLELLVYELRAELRLLRASHQRLKERVIALETSILNGVPQRVERAPFPPFTAPVSLVPLVSEKSRRTPVPVVAQSETRASLPVAPIAPVSQQPANVPLPDVAAPAESPKRPSVSIQLGADEQILAALSDLFSGDPGYAISREPLPDSALELAALYAALLVDDEGQEVGAVLADIWATANLGGKLAGLPSTVIDEQAKTGVLSEAVTSAMSEVCNTVSSVLNRVSGNCRVRSTPLESFPADRLSWLANANKVIALEKRRGGVLWILTR